MNPGSDANEEASIPITAFSFSCAPSMGAHSRRQSRLIERRYQQSGLEERALIIGKSGTVKLNITFLYLCGDAALWSSRRLQA